MPATKVLPCGLSKAILLQIGSLLDHCCGSAENVPLSTTSPSSPSLKVFRLHSRFRQECTQASLFCPRLIIAFLIDNPTVRQLSRISNPSATQDPLIWPTFFSITRTKQSRMLALYFPLSSFNSAINPHLVATFSLTATPPTNLAHNNPLTAYSYNVLKTCSNHQDLSRYILSLMLWTNAPTQRSFRRNAKRRWS